MVKYVFIPGSAIMALTSSQKRYLRGLTHDINPVVMVGDKGLTENVMNEVESALDYHELIKVKLRTDRDSRKAWISAMAEQTGSEVVHTIGQVACFYRPNPKKTVVELPRR